MHNDERTTVRAERQQQFTDAVLAIAITLLALDLPVPTGSTNGAMLRAAWHDRDDYLAFGISFAVIFAHWSGHHRVFRHVKATDRTLGQLTAIWLFLQVLTPFATKVLSGDGAFQTRFAFYALVQAAANLTFLLMVRHVQRADQSQPGTPPTVFQHSRASSAALMTGFTVSIPLSFLTTWAYACWAVVPIGAGLLTRKRG